jgi:hypothetical protein
MHLKKFLIVTYVVILHLLLAITIIKTDMFPRIIIRLGLVKPEIPNMESIIADRRASQQNVDSFVPKGATIFLGDSITLGLTADMIASIHPSIH